jgi:hypothetical protein
MTRTRLDWQLCPRCKFSGTRRCRRSGSRLIQTVQTRSVQEGLGRSESASRLRTGALAGFVFFLVMTFTPSDIPDDGGGSPGVVLIIAADLAIVGGVLGSSVGLVLGVIWHGLENRMTPMSTTRENVPKPGKEYQPFDDLLG